jgi:hypothetical protein
MELDFWNSMPGPIPAVDPNDLRKMWAYIENQDDAVGTDITVFKSICSPAADIFSVWYRASMLGLCDRVGLLSRWLKDGYLDDAVIKVAADFPMDKLDVDVVRHSLPFDVQEFLKRIDAESEKAKA